MRLEAQAKLGFYPVKPETIQFICRSLTVPAPEQTNLLDPCCGMGEALQSFTQTLGVPIEKTAPTDEDVDKALLVAAWRKVFFEKKKLAPLRPLLPMGAGHLGLTLASGLLDGYFAPEGWEPHVVRGISTKEKQLAKTETEISDTGKETTTQTFRENFKLKVRAITGDGTLSTIQ